MRTPARWLAASLFSLSLWLTAAVPVLAAEVKHIVDSVQLMHLTEQQAASRDADRAAIRDAISRPEVQQVAKRLGVDVQRITAAVDVMDGADLARAAEAARRANEALVGGASTVTISTTMIIIALLVLILIIVAVK